METNTKLNVKNKYACKNEDAIRYKEEKSDLRTPFFRDIDRILYSLAYIRYINKTQVFTSPQNDHISQRMIHVQFVSKIARTIGRALNLNEDLIEAAALGHDLGHTPYGHVGENFLNEISLKVGEGYFNHNVQSLRVLTELENFGEGLNITFQVLDAILCHNGEIVHAKYEPIKKTKEELIKAYENTYKEKTLLVPSTLEGCVVRISDLIGYIGRDLEDGIRLGLIKKSDVPKDIVNVLGLTNREIVNTIVLDIIENSLGKNYIQISDAVYNAIFNLKKFNYENIYYKAYTSKEKEHIKHMFEKVYSSLLNDLTNNNKSSVIYEYFNEMNDKYKKNTYPRIVIDFIAGMTDDYFKKTYENINKD